eukprot:CAMPEP_0184860940 /NCGR_PEP_ID=MMETSP0580-20130426/5727_1 /TAXON_ID=1118495 /ORGANISM="Dactyliosolen fragilissimus" /LENGTH=458 /DNA_ID=CAMNT_0027358225 /DNA_START=73 /DNA_END=1449 /DNA_ORIENTATION=+
MLNHKKILASMTLLSLFSQTTSTARQEAFVCGNTSPTYRRNTNSNNNGILSHHGGRPISVNIQSQSQFMGRAFTLSRSTRRTSKTSSSNRNSKSELNMFLGNDGGILGVGAPEVAVTLLVGYFILGPSDLYKLVKEIGKFIQNFRTLGVEASKSFESTMENELQLGELRKAQAELNDAFNFRRSINVDETAEAFSELPKIAQENAVSASDAVTVGGGTMAAATATSGATSVKTKKKRRRVKKKKVDVEQPPMESNIPDLDMSAAFQDEIQNTINAGPSSTTTTTSPLPPISDSSTFEEESEEEFNRRLREDRMQRLSTGTQPDTPPNLDWFSASETDIANQVLNQNANDDIDGESKAEEQSRFAAQLSNDWNAQILAKEDKLSPLSQIMERLAILEEERSAAESRLEEEFRMRTDLEEKYYRQKRDLLEKAAAEVQAEAYSTDVGPTQNETNQTKIEA